MRSRFRWLVFAVLGATPLVAAPPTETPLAAPPTADAPSAAAAPPTLVFEPDEAPALDLLLNLAAERSPALAAQRARIAAAGERVAPAGALANPMLETRLVDMGFPDYTVGQDEDSMLEVGVRQELPFPGKREARRAVARAAVETLRAELAAAERELGLDVRRLYARLYAIDQEGRALDEAHELLQLLAATAAARYGTGESEQEAVLKAQLEISLHDERREQVTEARAVAAAELRRDLDLPAATPIGPVSKLPEPIPLPDELTSAATAGAAELHVKRAMTAAAERELAAARLDLKPDFAASAGYGYRGSFDRAVTLGFSIELPFWRRQRQRPLVVAAEQEVAAAHLAERDAAATARARAETLDAAWQRIAAQLRLYDEAILPQSSAALDAARSSYLNANGDFSTVIEDYEQWLEARVRRAGLLAERFTTAAEIAALVAPSPFPPAGAQP